MKSVKELEQIRKNTLDKINMKNDKNAARIVVGMATCGLAAGAKPVYEALTQEAQKRGLKNAAVVQTGCIGVCRLEPIVEVYMPGMEKVTYVKVQPEMAARIMAEHVVNGRVAEDLTIGAYEAKAVK